MIMNLKDKGVLMASETHEKHHPYHLVDESPWPILSAFATLILAIGGVLAMHKVETWTFKIGVLALVLCAIGWWKDVFKESSQPGLYTSEVKSGLRIGMVLFIASEVMFFAAFFGAYFHASLDPQPATGGVWPPKSITPLDPFHFPYLNTLLLLLSGTTVTWAHHALMDRNRREVMQGLLLTVLLGMMFTSIQIFEYSMAGFKLSDGIYPSTFYLATGFHGAHVIIGTLFLMTCLYRSWKNEYRPEQHISFEAAAWYWHFVDVVWLFLFVSIYWWGYRAMPGVH